jgi:hypothetical protein
LRQGREKKGGAAATSAADTEASSPALTLFGGSRSLPEVLRGSGAAMNIAELIRKPIITPEYLDPTEAGRTIHGEQGRSSCQLDRRRQGPGT